MLPQNPFKPTAGKMPPVLVGRDAVIEDFQEGLDNGQGAPGRLMRITGPRGSGKTVLLSELASLADERGWLVVNVAATGNLPAAICKRLGKSGTLKPTSVKAGVPFASVEVGLAGGTEPDFETVLEQATRKMTARGTGLLITIDEIQDASHDDVREIATAVQFLIRDEQSIALVFAGITTGVLDLLNGRALTFLRRAQPEELDAIPISEVRDSLFKTIDDSGMSVTPEALDLAAQATAGYAYLIQLVGYYVWREARRKGRGASGGDKIEIDEQDARRGIERAMEEFKEAVLETAISGLPKTAIELAIVMSELGGVVAISDIAARMGKPTGYLSPYRRQLIARQIIEPTAPGYLAFSIPFMGEFLRERKQAILARYGE